MSEAKYDRLEPSHKDSDTRAARCEFLMVARYFSINVGQPSKDGLSSLQMSTKKQQRRT